MHPYRNFTIAEKTTLLSLVSAQLPGVAGEKVLATPMQHLGMATRCLLGCPLLSSGSSLEKNPP